jgi:hypothetical protein
LDVFGARVNFKIKDSESYQTGLGGVATLFTYLLTLVYMAFQFKTLIFYEGSIQTTVLENQYYPEDEIFRDEGFNIVFGIYNSMQ